MASAHQNRLTSDSSTFLACQDCGRLFDTQRGLSQHQRTVHPDSYYDAAGVAQRRKRRWDREESVLMAREESRLIAHGVSNINQELVKCVPGRTLEAIKSQRRNAAYRDILADMCNTDQDDGAVGPPVPASLDSDIDSGNTNDPDTDQDHTPTVTMTSSPVERVSDGSAFSPILFDSPVPGEPMNREDETRNYLWNDCLQYRNWLHISDAGFQSLGPRVLLHRDAGHDVGRDGASLQGFVDQEYSRWHSEMFGKKKRNENKGGIRRRPKVKPNLNGNPAGNLANQVTGGTAGSLETAATTKKNRRPSRRRRREQYSRVQYEYSKNRSRCAKTVLSGDWAKEKPSLPMHVQEGFWKPLMECASKTDARNPESLRKPCWSVVRPVTAAEVERALRGLKDGAPGPDRVDRQMLRKVHSENLAVHMNLWLLCECPPSAFREGITTLVPKSCESQQPSEYRPITVASIVARLFHRVLAMRLEQEVPLSLRQKAFRRGDGLADNVCILRSVLRDRTRGLKPIFVTFVDVAKAFDSVSHESMVKAAGQAGVPMSLLHYIRSLYNGTTTKLKVGKSIGGLIYVKRGVRQGDPLSPLLFNYVIDWVLSELDPQVGITLEGDLRLNHLAFADDVSLLSETKAGAVCLAKKFESGLSEVGLLPNARKSSTLAVIVDGRKKRWYCDSNQYLKLNGLDVPAMKVTDAYRYLGISVGAKVEQPDVKTRLEFGLQQLTKAPLKPQQRLYLLRVHLLPSLHHQLILDRVTQGTLSWLDRIVRKAVRGWLRLPHDLPKSMPGFLMVGLAYRCSAPICV